MLPGAGPLPSSFEPHSPAWRIECPPKINLYLRIVRRREDGFHELETVFQSVGGGDTLYGQLAADLFLTCTDPDVPADARNLVLRAALLLQERYPEAAVKGARLHLVKRTPTGAGMGGGSVDAAAAIVLLAHLWGLHLGQGEQVELGAALGSDIPFFFVGGTASARGRGEVLTPASTPPLWLVLLRPEVSVSTPWAYRQWRAEACGGGDMDSFLGELATGDPERVADALRNDLEPGVAAGVPEIAAAREWLEAQGVLGARMTGSGSVVFGLARDEAHARQIAAVPGAPGLLWAAPFLSAPEAALTVQPCGE
jgi:4-diphosphocytidyl-2-C-methyl-D-erythritol kinase